MNLLEIVHSRCCDAGAIRKLSSSTGYICSQCRMECFVLTEKDAKE
jgi:hypothetical protein